MKVALAHDSLTQTGGAERILDCLHEIFPEAAVYTLVRDKKFFSKYKNWQIKTSWLQFFYQFLPKFQYWLFFIPWAVKSLKPEAALIISSSSGFVKNLTKQKTTVHINYCHTPTRFLWGNKNYVDQEVPGALKGPVKLFLKWMQSWDYKNAQLVDYYIANSKEVQKRIKKYYQKDSTVIYPFVDENFWKPTKNKSNYFLVAGRLQAHKQNDLIIKVFNELGLPLHVVGEGRQKKYLRLIARPNIKFLGRVTDEQLRNEYSGALGFIFPQFEDFGLMPLEAAACGTATLALRAGGSLETVIEGITGEFFETFDEQLIKKIILTWDWRKYRLENLFNQAGKFKKSKFKNELINFVKNKTGVYADSN